MEELKDVLPKNEGSGQPDMSNGLNEVAEQLLEVGQLAIQQASVSGGVIAMLTCPVAIAFFVGILIGCIMNLISAWTGRLPLLEEVVTQDQQEVVPPKSD